MQRRAILHLGRMNVAKNQHVFESFFAPALVAAAALECFRIFESAKEDVPQWNVREVVGMMTELMVDPMRLWPLENEPNPRRRFDVPMVEEFSYGDENRVITGSADADSKQWIHN